MIDIHTHILPNLDDGPLTVQEALNLARTAWEAGTCTLVATPHVLNRLNSALNARLIEAFAEFRRILEVELPEMKLVLGSELYFQPGLADLAQYRAATINGTRRYLLVEFPLVDIPSGFERELSALQQAEIVPIIAHPERNGLVISKPATVKKMVHAGALIQINGGSLTGAFGRPVKKLAQNLLRMGWVHFIASDAHGMQQRGPDLRAAVEAAAQIIGAAAARRLVEEHPQIVLAGELWPGRQSAELLQAVGL